MLIDFAFRMGENYYSEVFFEECKYIVKGKKLTKYITDELKISDPDEDNYDEED